MIMKKRALLALGVSAMLLVSYNNPVSSGSSLVSETSSAEHLNSAYVA